MVVEGFATGVGLVGVGVLRVGGFARVFIRGLCPGFCFGGSARFFWGGLCPRGIWEAKRAAVRCRGSGLGVGGGVDVHQAGGVDGGVGLRCAQRGVAEKFLDRA